MTRWGLALGALAFLLVVVGTRSAGPSPVGAQVDTPEAAAGVGGTVTEPATTDPATTDPYQDFLAKLATNLGVGDAATVDAAIRTTLKQAVDERQSAGDLSADDAAAIKARIDAADVPLGTLGGHRGGHGGHGGSFGGRDRDGLPGGLFDGHDRDGRGDRTDDEDDAGDASGLPETRLPSTPATPTL